MTGVWQAALIGLLGVVCLHAAEPQKSFSWNPPKVARSMFTQELGMLDSEREEYATNLATRAAVEVAGEKASSQSLVDARRMLGLALHLSPRNKRALVVNFQLAKGMIPDIPEGNYSQQVFARLLLTRGQLLEKQGGEENKRLARCFIQLAAEMDPKNEDAVYASETHRLDQGDVDWSGVTDAPAKESDDKKP